MTQILALHRGYNASHPWYYLLGGAVPTLKQIRSHAEIKSNRGYLADEIDAAHAKQEPKRSAALRKIKAEVVDGLNKDISCYREVVRELRTYQRDHRFDDKPSVCAEVHTSMGLKFAHIYNGFAHLKALDDLPNQQMELF